MMIATSLALAVLPLLAVPDGPATYRNPVLDYHGAADPHVVCWEGRYYLTSTTDGRGYDVFVSDDLAHWQQHPKCYEDKRGGVWAPDMFRWRGDGQWYLYYTANQPSGGKLVGVAKGPSPLGPFVDQKVLAPGSIDGHLFQDDDGQLYFYHVVLPGGFRIVAQKMSDPLTPVGEPRTVIRPTEPWEKAHGQVTEGPFIVKHGGLYYLMYSGSGADGPNYAIGYATSSSPMGPFTKYAGNPIAKRGNGIFGPGHHCVVTGPDGKLWMVYHQKRNEGVNWDRYVAIDPLWFDDQGVMHTRLTRDTDEPAPVPPRSETGRSSTLW